MQLQRLLALLRLQRCSRCRARSTSCRQWSALHVVVLHKQGDTRQQIGQQLARLSAHSAALDQAV